MLCPGLGPRVPELKLFQGLSPEDIVWLFGFLPSTPPLGTCWRRQEGDGQDQRQSNKQMSRKVFRGKQKRTNTREDGSKAKERRGVSTPKREGTAFSPRHVQTLGCRFSE